MAGGGKGGRQTTEVTIPAWLEAAAQDNIARAEQIMQIGPASYSGPTAAAFTDPQQQAFHNTGQAAAAFGLADPGVDLRYQPVANSYANGVQGYSAAPMYDQAMSDFRQSAPGQFDFISGMFIDPRTGAAPTNSAFRA